MHSLTEHANHPHKKVIVWVRHSRTCTSRRSGRYVRGCGCALHLEFMCGGEQIKTTANTTDWLEAEHTAAQLELGEHKPLKRAVTVPALEHKTAPGSITAAVKLFLTKKYDEGAAEPTIGKKRRMLTWMDDYHRALGIGKLADVSAETLLTWRSTWRFKKHADENGLLRLPSSSLKVHQGLVTEFFKWALKTNLMASNPAAAAFGDKLKVDREQEQRQPYTPEEMARIVAAVQPSSALIRHPYGWSEDELTRIRALIAVMRWGGLAINDAATLRRSALDNEDRITLKRTKTRNEVKVKLPPDVARALRAVPNGDPLYFFWMKPARTVKAQVNKMHLRLSFVFKVAGVEGGTSHRFRHTYAVENLLAGMRMEDVSRLLGHKRLATTEKYYNAWIPDRQKELEKQQEEAWARQERRMGRATAATA